MIRSATPSLSVLLALAMVAPAAAQQNAPPSDPCTPERRTEVLREIQAQVLAAVPNELPSLVEAVGPGGGLEGWRLSHGLVVLAGAGSVAVDNIEAEPPVPPILLYEPSPGSSPEDWLDFDKEEGPYRLVGWAYFAPWTPESSPPALFECIGADEWFLHEAGWHLRDGGMHLGEPATSEPPAPPDVPAPVHFWHPRVWDIHFWRGEEGVPDVTFDNPRARPGGLPLPEGSFFRLVDGEKQPITSGGR